MIIVAVLCWLATLVVVGVVCDKISPLVGLGLVAIVGMALKAV